MINSKTVFNRKLVSNKLTYQKLRFPAITQSNISIFVCTFCTVNKYILEKLCLSTHFFSETNWFCWNLVIGDTPYTLSSKFHYGAYKSLNMKKNFLKIAYNTKNIHDIICRCHDQEPLTETYYYVYISSIYRKINCDGIPGSNLETQSRATKYFPYDGIWMPWWNVIWTLTRLPIWNESE